MRPVAIIGVALIVLGGAFLYQGDACTSREPIVDIGPLQATADRRKMRALPLELGIAAVAGGAALLLAGVRRKRA